MLQLSQRARLMPASPIRRLVPYAEKAKARGIKVYHLNIGQPDIETPAEIMRGYREVDIKVLGYGHSAGLQTYIQTLVSYYHSVGIDVTGDDILVTTGGSEAILFAIKAVTDPGDEVIVPEPFYTNYFGFAVMAGVKLVPITTHADNGFALPSKEQFVRLITPRTKAILFSNPGNPTGVVYSEAEMELLRQLALEYNLFLIGDEVYREFVYDEGVQPLSVLNLKGVEDRTVMVDSISKRYSACGARVGCVVSRNRDFMAAMLRFGQARLCPPTVDQLAAQRAQDIPPSYFAQVRDEYRRRRDVLCDELSKIPGVKFLRPRGAFYLIARLPVPDAEAFAIFLLNDFHLDHETVMLAPAQGFYATPGLGNDEVRIAYVLKCEDLVRAVRVLAAGLKAFPHRTE
ncbi:pyridoxal phosphate-dependent aminotransferase [candidate division WOR-3 bacterium]|nr:pyridoxal phosphate-dependent aminotransferase [candidate division WOR-3 bacterium]